MKTASEMRILATNAIATRENTAKKRVHEYCEKEIANRIERFAKEGRNNIWVSLRELKRIPYITESTVIECVKEHLSSVGYKVTAVDNAGFRIMW